MIFFFFFKQKAAYELRISDWSSDVCSSDLLASPLAVAAVFILAAFEALFVALAAALTRWLAAPSLPTPSGYGRYLLLAAVWASAWKGTEWLRGILFTGLHWKNIRYAHVHGVLAPLAPVCVVHGIDSLAASAADARALFVSTKVTHKSDSG